MKSLHRVLSFMLGVCLSVPPAFSDSKTLTSSSDTYVSSSAPTLNFGTEQSIYLNRGSDILLGYLKFSLSTLPADISIQSASLKIYCPSSSFCNGSIIVSTVANSWSESTLTWSPSHPNGIAPSISYTSPGTTGWWTINVTTIVKEWIEKGVPNYGFRFEKGEDGLIQIRSRENSTYPPKLEITYSSNQYSASGLVSGSLGEGVSSVQMNFSRLSGTGSIPDPVVTTAQGEWFQSNFKVGTNYRVSPSRTGYVFTPPSKDFNGTSGDESGLNFTTTTTFSISFTSEPTSATVYLNLPSPDNLNFKTTPCTFTNISANQLFTIVKSGYDNQEYISKISDASETIHIILTEIKPIGEIIDFVVPSGLINRETSQTFQVTIKNNDIVTRSFWLGLSLADEYATGEGWPLNWYDILPKESELILPGNTSVITFEIIIPGNWTAGQYYATTAIWDDFDEENFVMIGLPSDITSQFDIPFDRLTWHSEFTDKPNVGKRSFLLNPFNSPLTFESVFSDIFNSALHTPLDGLYKKGQKPILYLSVKGQCNFLVNGFPINVSLGSAFFIDLADLCEYTPEGKDGWTTVWIASKIGALTYDLTKPIESIKPGITVPVDAGILFQEFDYNKRGIADLKHDKLEYGKFSIPGLSITAFTLEETGEVKWFNPTLGGSIVHPMKFQAADATNIIWEYQISNEFVKKNLLSAISPSFTTLEEIISNFLSIVETTPDSPSTYDKYTIDDGYWEIQNGIAERNLAMNEINNSWMNSKNCFKLIIPENASNLIIQTREGIGVPDNGYGDLSLYWRLNHPVFENNEYLFSGAPSVNIGSVIEDIYLSAPEPGSYYIALPIVAPTNKYENVTLIASYETTNSYITITSPNGGETWQAGSSQGIKWNSSGTSGNVRIEYSTNNGGSWIEITPSTSDDGLYSWTVSNASSNNCLIRIIDVYGNSFDQSNSNFTISFTDNTTSYTLENQINIYPNPIKDFIIIDLLMSESETINIKLISNNGVTKYSELLKSIPPHLIKRIPISDLASGIYMVIIQFKNRVYYQKIIIE